MWRAPYLQDGHPVAIAVDSHGRRVAAIALFPGVSNGEVRDLLTIVLDAVDPQPALRLVDDRSSGEIPPISVGAYLLLRRHRG